MARSAGRIAKDRTLLAFLAVNADALVGGGRADLPIDNSWLVSMHFLVEAWRALADIESADDLYRRLRPYAGRVALAGPPPLAAFGLVSLDLGHLARLLGDFEEARRHLLDAMVLAGSLRSRPFVAQIQCAYAALLLDRREPKDAHEAADRLDEALNTANDLGMVPLIERIERLRATTWFESGG
jgi:hypothetical protein